MLIFLKLRVTLKPWTPWVRDTTTGDELAGEELGEEEEELFEAGSAPGSRLRTAQVSLHHTAALAPSWVPGVEKIV